MNVNNNFNFFCSYGKYKPLKAPATCRRCHQKRIKSAYHTLCSSCVEELSACAKCGEKESEVVNAPAPTQQQLDRAEAELQKLLKKLPERRRRTAVRKLQEEGEGVSEEFLEEVRDLVEKYGRKGDDDFSLGNTETNKIKSILGALNLPFFSSRRRSRGPRFVRQRRGGGRRR